MDTPWLWPSFVLTALVYLGGIVILIRCRRRSRRATTLALVALTLDWLFVGMLASELTDPWKSWRPAC